jgi:hypothetical protein
VSDASLRFDGSLRQNDLIMSPQTAVGIFPRYEIDGQFLGGLAVAREGFRPIGIWKVGMRGIRRVSHIRPIAPACRNGD